MKVLKKALALLLALVMCVGMLSLNVFAAEGGEEPTEVVETVSAAKAASKDCGIGNHDWKYVTTKEATCTEWGEKQSRCTKCGKDQPGIVPMPVAPKGHNWEFVSCAKKLDGALCTAGHQDLMRCTVCGSEGERFNASGHSHDLVITRDAVDLGQIGEYDTNLSHTVKCTNCTYVGIEFHDFADATCMAPPTCECGHTRGEKNPSNHACVQTNSYDANGHFKVYGCNGEEVPGTREAHTFTGATCLTAGTCKCGATGTTDSNTHVGTPDWRHDDTQHWQVYSTCHHETAKTSHEFKDYKQNSDGAWVGTCVCGATDTRNVVPHTCVADSAWRSDGTNHWHACIAAENCPAELDKAAHGEGTVKTRGTAATCVDTGLTDELECPTCKAILQKQTVISALGHEAGTHHDEVPASCLIDGTRAYDECVRCDALLLNGEACTEQDLVITAPGSHAWNGGVVTTQPTETTEGVRTFTCTRAGCDASYTESIPAIGTGTTDPDPTPGPGGDTDIDDPDVPLGGTDIDAPAVPLAGLMTRAEFVNYLYVQANSPEAELSSFSDVPEDHEYAKAIGWAQANGIAKGITDDEFAPDEIVTAGQARLFLERYAQAMGIEMPVLDALAGKDPEEILDNADEVLAQFFAKDEAAAA